MRNSTAVLLQLARPFNMFILLSLQLRLDTFDTVIACLNHPFDLVIVGFLLLNQLPLVDQQLHLLIIGKIGNRCQYRLGVERFNIVAPAGGYEPLLARLQLISTAISLVGWLHCRFV